jgi:hypothetical protein
LEFFLIATRDGKFYSYLFGSIFNLVIFFKRELEGKELQILTEDWKNLLRGRFKQLLNALVVDLALDVSAIRAELYKLVIYEKGNYVKKRQEDSHGNKKHFATLMIFLPSYYTGGDFVVHQQHHTQSAFNFSISNGRETKPLKCHYVLFLNNNEYEIKPIKSGVVVTLIYDLYYENNLMPKPIKVITKALLESKVQSVIDDLRDYTTSIGIFLAHPYSIGPNCQPNTLTGEDKKMYDLLICLPKDKYKITIVLLKITFSGFTHDTCNSDQPLKVLLQQAIYNGDDVEVSVATIIDIEQKTEQSRGKGRKSPDIRSVNCRQYHHVTQFYLGGDPADHQVGEVQFINIASFLTTIKDIETDHEVISSSDDGLEFKVQCVHAAIKIEKRTSKERFDQVQHPVRKKQKIK